MNLRIPHSLLFLSLVVPLSGCSSDPTAPDPGRAGTSAGGSAGVSAAGQGGVSGRAGGGSGGTTSNGGSATSGSGGVGGTGGSAPAGGAGSGGAGATGANGGAGGAAGAGGSALGGASGAGAGNAGIGGTNGGASPGGAAGTSPGGAAGAGGGSVTCPTDSIAPGETTRMVQVGSTMRSYVLHVPASYTGDAAVPLVVDFHGLMSTPSGEKTAMGLAPIAASENFIVAWPAGIDNAWNVGPCCTQSRDVDDVGFARALVADIQAEACIDPKRIYATGFSMGGGMSHYLACHAADLFAAAAPHAFDLLTENEADCMPSRPISVLSFRATNDNLVRYAGGASSPPNGCCPDIHFLGAVNTLTKWSELAECTGSPITMGNTQFYMDCAGGVRVGLTTIQNGGHAPGPARDAWDFLKTQTLP